MSATTEDVLSPDSSAAQLNRDATTRQPGTRALIRQDFSRWCETWAGETTATPRSVRLRVRARLAFHECGLRATLLYRFSSGMHRAGVPFLPGLFRRMNITLYGLDIPPSVKIGGGLYIPHPVGTAIMANSIGSNASIISCVTIGMRGEWAFPTIGDSVFLGAGARILGGITIGDGASIGANAVVLSDIPAGATAVGVPARVLKRADKPAATLEDPQL